MSYLLTFACYIVTFSPAIAIFCKFIAHDPVRIILFFLGAFFWLVSLLFSSFFWFGVSYATDTLIVSALFCIGMQELARVAYFMLLKKAQKGLNKITRPGQISVAPGVTDLHNARHMLALVCGLGMGVMAALFLTMNAFAAFSQPGTVGLPEALQKDTANVNPAGKYLPMYYALSGLLLTLFNVTWTIMVWDSCHKIGRIPSAWVPGAAAVVSHVLVSMLSTANARGFYTPVLFVQFLLLITCVTYCHVVIGRSVSSLVNGVGASLLDAVTLKWIRGWIAARRGQSVPVQAEQPMVERNAIAI